MKLLHISDLHIGKKLHGYSLYEDQRFILKQILDIAKEQQVDAIIVAGDVYDKSVPSETATEVFEEWITAVAESKIQIYIISGNHDSRSRLGFGSKIFKENGIHLVTEYDGKIETFSIGEGRDEVKLYMLPFVKLRELRKFFPDAKLDNINDAFKEIFSKEDIDPDEKNVLVAHQHVDGGVISESEAIMIGGLEEVNASLFQDFSYVALGHLHRPQALGSETIRYSGSILSYSQSEARVGGTQAKECVTVEFDDKGEVKVETIPLHPMREVVIVRGLLEEIEKRGGLGSEWSDDLVYFELTDEKHQPQVMSRLREFFKTPLAIKFSKSVPGRGKEHNTLASISNSPMENIEGFFKEMYNKTLTKEEKEIIDTALSEIENEGER